jgi:hypothetical protein
MAFNFNWSPLTADADFYRRARDLLTKALNKSPKPPIIVDDILVSEFNLGTVPPDLEILEIGDLAEDRFRGIFKMTYSGDAFLTLKTRVQVSDHFTSVMEEPTHFLRLNYFLSFGDNCRSYIPLIARVSHNMPIVELDVDRHPLTSQLSRHQQQPTIPFQVSTCTLLYCIVDATFFIATMRIKPLHPPAKISWSKRPTDDFIIIAIPLTLTSQP